MVLHVGSQQADVHVHALWMAWSSQHAFLHPMTEPVDKNLPLELMTLPCMYVSSRLLLCPGPVRWGPLINARFAWVWMESPNLYVSAACWLWGRDECRSSLANRVLLLMFVGHYTNRSLIYPLQMRGGRPMPLSIMLMAQVRRQTESSR